MENLKLQSNLNDNNLDVVIGQNKLKITLMDAPTNSCLGAISQAIAYQIEENFHIALYAENNKLNILYTQESPKVRSINIKLESFESFNFQKNKAIGKLGKLNIAIDVIDGTIVTFNKGILTLSTSSPDLRIEMYQVDSNKDFVALNYFSPLTIDSNIFVPIGSRVPEFSIGIFDHVWTHPRPIRFGVPVISTVPAHGEDLTDEEQYYYDQGKGPKSKTMYFRVVCSQELSSDLPVKLLIYLPNGLDTITNPIAVSLTKISVSGPSVYSGSYVFYEEDTIFTVDGFVYFSVYVDIIQQIALPIKADDPAATFTTRATSELRF